MVRYIILIIILFNLNLIAGELDSNQITKIADAIKLEENSPHFPYGVHYYAIHDEIRCRQICINTISNNYLRWRRQRTNADYVDFLSRKYDPVNARSWAANVRMILGSAFCAQINKNHP